MNTLGIGLDFGNSNTTMAVFDGETLTYVKIDHSLERGTVMPSALYIGVIGTEELSVGKMRINTR